MNTKRWRWAVACLLAASSAVATADPRYSYVGVDFMQIKPDDAYTSSGTDIGASFGVADTAYIAFGHQSISIEPHGVLGGTTYDFRNDLLEFVGHTNGAHVDCLFGINYQSRTFPSPYAFYFPTSTVTDSGFGPTLGFRFHPNDHVDIDTILRYTNFSDFGGRTDAEVGLTLHIADHVGLNGGYLIDDKYSGFRLGLRVNF